MCLSIFEGSGKVKRIDLLIGIETDVKVGSSDGIDERFVFIFRIKDDHIRSHHESTQDLQLHSKRLSST